MSSNTQSNAAAWQNDRVSVPRWNIQEVYPSRGLQEEQAVFLNRLLEEEVMNHNSTKMGLQKYLATSLSHERALFYEKAYGQQIYNENRILKQRIVEEKEKTKVVEEQRNTFEEQRDALLMQKELEIVSFL
jgi:hypothetical protein